MLSVENLERHAFVVGTVAFGEPECEPHITFIGDLCDLAAHLQVDIICLALLDIGLLYPVVAGVYSVQDRFFGFRSDVVYYEHHLAARRFGEGGIAVLVLESRRGKVGIIHKRGLSATIYIQSAVAEYFGASINRTGENIISGIRRSVRRRSDKLADFVFLFHYLRRPYVFELKVIAHSVVLEHQARFKLKLDGV